MQEINNFLKKSNFKPSKKMGQNFLSDHDVIHEIFSYLPNLNKYDCILEIGPGLGAMTNHLIKQNKPVISIELDKRLYAFLVNKFNNNPNLRIINDDFLTVDLDKILSAYKNIIVIANIPYSITTPIVVKCLSYYSIKTLFIMVQKDVAIKWYYDKTTNRNASTNILNYYFNIDKKMDIKNTSFTPPPKIDSSIVQLDKKTTEQYDPNFYKFIKQFFLSKRKTLLNNLPPYINRLEFTSIIQKMGYPTNIRAENLNYNDWKKLYSLYRLTNDKH